MPLVKGPKLKYQPQPLLHKPDMQLKTHNSRYSREVCFPCSHQSHFSHHKKSEEKNLFSCSYS
jgi:hypothetical protein